MKWHCSERNITDLLIGPPYIFVHSGKRSGKKISYCILKVLGSSHGRDFGYFQQTFRGFSFRLLSGCNDNVLNSATTSWFLALSSSRLGHPEMVSIFTTDVILLFFLAFIPYVLTKFWPENRKRNEQLEGLCVCGVRAHLLASVSGCIGQAFGFHLVLIGFSEIILLPFIPCCCSRAATYMP